MQRSPTTSVPHARSGLPPLTSSSRTASSRRSISSPAHCCRRATPWPSRTRAIRRPEVSCHHARQALVGIAVDDEGIVVDAIPPTVRLVIVTPSHQFPLGVAMSLRRPVWPSCAGPRNTMQRSSRTTTTVSSASAAARSSRSRASTRLGEWSTPRRSRRRCSPRCGSGLLVTPPSLRRALGRGEVRDRLGDVDS